MMDDKRTSYIDLYGKRYPLCLTVSAQERITQTFGGLGKMAAAMDENGEVAVGALADLMHILMCGGRDRAAALAWMAGEEAEAAPQIPECAILKGLLTLEDIKQYQGQLFEAIRLSSGQEVEVDPEKGKNAETT